MAGNETVNDHEVSETAFHLWLSEGKPDGMAQEHWFRAKEILAARDTFAAQPDAPPAAEAAKPKVPRARKAAAAPEAAEPVDAPARKPRKTKNSQ